MFVFRKSTHKTRVRAISSATSLAALLLIALALTACGIPAEPLPEPKPLQSSIATPGVPPVQVATNTPNTPITPVAVQVVTIAPSATVPTAPLTPTVAIPTAAVAPLPSVTANAKLKATRTLTATLTPTIDPAAPATPTVSNPSGLGTFLTSTSVVGTITALAATPTYPPTDVPRVRRRPAIIGAAGDAVPPTTVPDKTGINVQNKSQRVFPKGPATLTIKTKPGVACELSNIRKNKQGRDVLEPIISGSAKTSGSDGVIAWIWSVDGDEPLGNMTLVIDCRTVGVKQVTMDVAK